MKNLLYIGNNLSTARHNITSIQALGSRLETEGYNIRYASSKSHKLLRLIDMLWHCVRCAKWADVVLIDTYSTQNFYYAFFCSQLCRLMGVPYIPILHGGNLTERLERSPNLSRLIFKYSQANVSPSVFLKTAFETHQYNVTYIPNSIDIGLYKAKAKSFDSIRLLWVRSFSELYNPEMAISVAKILKDRGYKVSLCMIGPDNDGSMTSCKRLAKDLAVDVIFTGKLSKTDWIAKSQYYNIFINTTNFDNMPVSVIEAKALGFPIVSTNAGGLPYIIKDKVDGLLINKNDHKAMTAAIIKIFENESFRAQLSKNARENVRDFDWQNVKDRWASIL